MTDGLMTFYPCPAETGPWKWVASLSCWLLKTETDSKNGKRGLIIYSSNRKGVFLSSWTICKINFQTFALRWSTETNIPLQIFLHLLCHWEPVSMVKWAQAWGKVQSASSWLIDKRSKQQRHLRGKLRTTAAPTPFSGSSACLLWKRTFRMNTAQAWWPGSGMVRVRAGLYCL